MMIMTKIIIKTMIVIIIINLMLPGVACRMTLSPVSHTVTLVAKLTIVRWSSALISPRIVT